MYYYLLHNNAVSYIRIYGLYYLLNIGTLSEF